MAKVIETIEREDGHKIAIYESGAQYDLTAGRLVSGPPQARFNNETAVEARQRQVEMKREAILRGAARALDKDEWDKPNDLDVIEAISEAVTKKALNSDSPKQVDAARFILQESGMAENQTPSTAGPQQFAAVLGDFTALAGAMAQIVRDVLTAQQPAEQIHEVIDVPSSD